MAAKTNQLTVTLPSDTEILLTREFEAPRELVWKAMTTPELIKQWWGWRTSRLVVCEIDLRVGGAWRYVSRAEDGTDHPFKGVFKEIVAPERIAQTWCYDVPPINEKESLETMTLIEKDGRTIMTTLVKHENKVNRDGHIHSGMEKGAGETMDRLEELLAKMA
jgi:uncharacterized protein YndB with AHSA1/START domain